jgi:hypothetical protein
MKQIITLFTFAAVFSACNYHSETGSGNTITQNKTVGNFTGISASNAIEVEVKIGSPAAVKIEADDNVIEYVKAIVKGNTLKIGLARNVSINNATIKVYVTVPDLAQLSASSSSVIRVINIIKSNGKLSFDASSSADIEAVVEAPEVYVEASSSGTVSLSGKTQNYLLQGSSAGSIKTAALLAENTIANVSSAATAEVHASVSLTANPSSGAVVKYKGGATVKENTSSGGSVSKIE